MQIDWIDADRRARPPGYMGPRERLKDEDAAFTRSYLANRKHRQQMRDDEAHLMGVFLKVQGDLFKDPVSMDGADNEPSPKPLTEEEIKAAAARADALFEENTHVALSKIAVLAMRHDDTLLQTQHFLMDAGEEDTARKLEKWCFNAAAIKAELTPYFGMDTLIQHNGKIPEDMLDPVIEREARDYHRHGRDPIQRLRESAGTTITNHYDGWEKDEKFVKDLVHAFEPFTAQRLELLSEVETKLISLAAPMARDFTAFKQSAMAFLPEKAPAHRPQPPALGL